MKFYLMVMSLLSRLPGFGFAYLALLCAVALVMSLLGKQGPDILGVTLPAGPSLAGTGFCLAGIMISGVGAWYFLMRVPLWCAQKKDELRLRGLIR